MSDKLVFDLAQEVEGSPNVFVRKDWLNILDNQNQNYNNNQSVVDTSQLSNSNKYMSYREAYFSIPFTVTVASTSEVLATAATAGRFDPTTAAKSADYAIGLKNWFGQIIHSFTLDYNGTTIIQQTPYINMWNSFKLMTSLSLDDINTQGATIGFYPDDAMSWQFASTASPYGQGVCNNSNSDAITTVSGALNNFRSGGGNEGFLLRQGLINFDANASAGTVAYSSLIYGGATANGFCGSINNLWKSYIYNKVASGGTAGAVQTSPGIIQYGIVATVYLKHIHSFFNMCPLLKGVFMKMTMNLNNTTTEFVTVSTSALVGAVYPYSPTSISVSSISNPLGGVNPLMIASGALSVGSTSVYNGGIGLFPGVSTVANAGAVGTDTITYRANISVGAVCLDSTINSAGGASVVQAPLSRSIYLYIPAYTFNPVFEQAYLSSPVKQIKYTDVYQYQVISVAANGNFNNLLTNGIANVKSVLILPYYSSASSATAVGASGNIPVFQSPFDPAGTGPTSPMCWITNFNVQVSGQNAIYNLEKYNFEQFNNQLYGQNAVNGGLTDGITSGLIDRQRFDMEYCYYYVNIERMLPVEMSVPKSIQILGQNMSSKPVDLYCFVEYGVEISIDALTGARV